MPSTSHKDLVVKRGLYERNNVREYWVVDSGNRCVPVYLLDDKCAYPEEPALYSVGEGLERPVLESRVLPGFVVDLRELFAG